jgi:hypothetical protein
MEMYFELRRVFDKVWAVDELPLGLADRQKVKEAREILERVMEGTLWNAKEIQGAQGPRFGPITQWAAKVKQDGERRRLAADLLAEAALE